MPDAPTPASATRPNYIDLAADIIAAYVTKNAVPVADLPSLIATVHSALTKAGNGASEPPKEDLRPAVPIKKSIMPDFLISLEDGKRYKSLKRHLRTSYGMTPVSFEMGFAIRLSHRCAKLCEGAFATRSDVYRM